MTHQAIKKSWPINNICSTLSAVKSMLQEDVLHNRERRKTLGDKGGKKDKDKVQKQHNEKEKQKSKEKLNKQPKRKP